MPAPLSTALAVSSQTQNPDLRSGSRQSSLNIVDIPEATNSFQEAVASEIPGPCRIILQMLWATLKTFDAAAPEAPDNYNALERFIPQPNDFDPSLEMDQVEI